jgi:hypothetical protein
MYSSSILTNSPEELKGDLVSAPAADEWYRIEEVSTLEKMVPHAPLHERSTMRNIIRERIQMCRAELDAVGAATRQTMLHGMGPQFRLRMDFQRLKIACEQWMPSLRLWLVNGYYDPATTARQIVEDLKRNDPRREENDPLTQLAERRLAAAKKRAENEAAGDAKVLAAVDQLGSRGITQFLEVERALRTGEQITFRGDDAKTLENLTNKTKAAAAQGDQEAQSVLTHGVRDTPALVPVPRKPKPHTR